MVTEPGKSVEFSPLEKLALELEHSMRRRTQVNISSSALETSMFLTRDGLVEKMIGNTPSCLNMIELPGTQVEQADIFTRNQAIPVYEDEKIVYVAVCAENTQGRLKEGQILGETIGSALVQHIEQSASRKEQQYVLLNQADYDLIRELRLEDEKARKHVSAIKDDDSGAEILGAIIRRGMKFNTSDIHIEPLSDESARIRYRIDGILHVSTLNIGSDKLRPVLSALKNKAGLDITEVREPQDGGVKDISFAFEEQPTGALNTNQYSLRVSTVPVSGGEKAVIRIMDNDPEISSLVSLGYNTQDVENIESVAKQPKGLMLVTGPTGSGKSTTLYSILQRLNETEVNIMTIEDPIEKHIQGMNQSQVNRARSVEYDFAKALRSFLRQDPDIILVGEIRDAETAGIALSAANTGHMVFSTLHTDDAIYSVLRLLELGIDPSFIQAGLQGVLAQRLARKLCTECKEDCDIASELSQATGEIIPRITAYTTSSKTSGCSSCGGLGYRGRTTVYEFWRLDDEDRNLIFQRETSHAKYRQTALKTSEGQIEYKPLGVHSMELLRKGTTSFEEICRVVGTNQLRTDATEILAYLSEASN